MPLKYFLALAILATPLLAKEPPKNAGAYWPMPPGEFFLKKLPPPPAAGSPQEKADLAYTIKLQAAVTPAELKEAHAIAVNLSVFSFANIIARRDFNAAAYPRTAAFFQKLDNTDLIPKNFIKQDSHRLRPFEAYPNLVKALVPKEPGYSFPSGHVTRAEMDAQVLALLVPAKKKALLAFVDQVATARVLGGMHYRSDVETSKLFGTLIFQQLLKQPAFLDALNMLKAQEWPEASK